jgi:hypothetical protein
MTSDSYDKKLVELIRTSAYTIGPAAVTNIARPNLARPEVNIFADIHTGMETIAQIKTSEIIAIITKANIEYVKN